MRHKQTTINVINIIFVKVILINQGCLNSINNIRNIPKPKYTIPLSTLSVKKTIMAT